MVPSHGEQHCWHGELAMPILRWPIPVGATRPGPAVRRLDLVDRTPLPARRARRVKPQRENAAAWLLQFLADGPRPATEVRAQALAAGLHWATIRRAKDTAGVEIFKEGFGWLGTWAWRLAGAGVEQVGRELIEHLSGESDDTARFE